ncbi:hypothetical protein KGF56_002651 [Candida oxycetoniae]|uniref:ABC transporter domain-containing protein n=1 Tax=Candida oxycetoniae TaxID=497107 RepID=A0AAI9SXJ5_9ASCO|nr:uncharacterized protein KGF56_002651 [Candida oxycetoniae]KAI3404552.2 hypothetical protein KGF56_002651 [Candida oxycetoniae]
MSSLRQGCILSIKNANFKPNTLKKTPFLFQNPITNFQISQPLAVKNATVPTEGFSSWVITGPYKSNMVKVIAGKYISFPPLSRTYPLINEPATQLQFLDFKDKSGLDVVHMSARYESFSYKGQLEMSDDTNSVFNYIAGSYNYNAQNRQIDQEYIKKLLKLFNLEHLQNKWINLLSNGQMRRARIAKALVHKPKLLIIDDPFLGLDPSNTVNISHALKGVCAELNISIVLGLRLQDEPPKWVEGIAYVDQSGLSHIKDSDRLNIKEHHHQQKLANQVSLTAISPQEQNNVSAHIEFENAKVSYKDDVVLFQNFNWKIPKGSKWRIMGDNGTGKTTLLSLITADHPQSWKSVLKINNVLRKAGSGVTFFDVNNKIGISSPELHALVPQHGKTMLEIILNGLVPNIGNSNFMYRLDWAKLDRNAQERAMYILDHFKNRIEASGNCQFGDLSITDQKLALFLRAIIKNPEILILDEAFSCMEDEDVMIRCHEFIASDPILQNTTLLAVGHIDWEIPKCDYLLKLLGDEDRNYEMYRVAY